MVKRPAPLTLRLGELEDEVLSRGDRPGLTIKRDLRRYYDLLSANIPQLTLNDAQAALDATKGKAIEPAYLWAALTTGGDESLGARVRAMSPIEKLALADALERAWQIVQSGKSDQEALANVGLGA